MNSRIYWAMSLLLIGWPSLAAERMTLRMNAAIKDDSQQIAQGTYSTIEVANTLPRLEYRLETKVQAHAVTMPDIDAELKKIKEKYRNAVQPQSVHGGPHQACTDLAAASAELLAATAETRVRALVDRVTALGNAAKSAGCHAEVDEATLVVERTRREFDTHLQVDEGSFATVTLYRLHEQTGAPEQVARKVFDTGELGTVRTQVALGGLPNDDERWFAKPTSVANEFVITREEDRDDYDPLAALLLSWEPARNTSGWTQAFAFKRGAISGSWAVGIGTQTDQLIYLLGYALSFTPRFGVAGGIAGFDQQRLRGIYKGDGTDKVTGALTPAQIMDETLGTGLWFGITLKP